MKKLLFLSLALLLASCSYVVNVPKFNKGIHKAYNKSLKGQEAIEDHYGISRLQYLAVQQQAQPADASKFEKLTSIFQRMGQEKEKYDQKITLIESAMQTEKSYEGKKKIKSDDPEWEEIKDYKESIATELDGLRQAYTAYQAADSEFSGMIKDKPFKNYVKDVPARILSFSKLKKQMKKNLKKLAKAQKKIDKHYAKAQRNYLHLQSRGELSGTDIFNELDASFQNMTEAKDKLDGKIVLIKTFEEKGKTLFNDKQKVKPNDPEWKAINAFEKELQDEFSTLKPLFNIYKSEADQFNKLLKDKALKSYLKN